jgi:hypothetical protein
MTGILTDEARWIAQNLARNCGYRVFPARLDKKPACERGFLEASDDPGHVEELWRRYPAPLIGVATGEASGVDVLDIDVKHDEALAWWTANERHIPSTRTYRTRSGGLHLYFRHAPGVRCTTGRVCRGIDTRGDGGYAIFWFAAGLECLDHCPPAVWPMWLLAELRRTEELARRPARVRTSAGRQSRSVDAINTLIANAAEGERNNLLYWGACRVAELLADGQLSTAEAESMLLASARAAGLSVCEARATIRSGLRSTAA